MQVPSDPEAIAAAMDTWEEFNGSVDLYDELVTNLGKTEADRLWDLACNAYDAMRS